jgi:hypothetical protein
MFEIWVSWKAVNTSHAYDEVATQSVLSLYDYFIVQKTVKSFDFLPANEKTFFLTVDSHVTVGWVINDYKHVKVLPLLWITLY